MDPVIAGDGDIEVTRAQNRNFLLGDGFHRMARESNSFTLLLRYQAQAERHYRRARRGPDMPARCRGRTCPAR
jgi:hypothetical protein